MFFFNVMYRQQLAMNRKSSPTEKGLRLHGRKLYHFVFDVTIKCINHVIFHDTSIERAFDWLSGPQAGGQGGSKRNFEKSATKTVKIRKKWEEKGEIGKKMGSLPGACPCEREGLAMALMLAYKCMLAHIISWLGSKCRQFRQRQNEWGCILSTQYVQIHRADTMFYLKVHFIK